MNGECSNTEMSSRNGFFFKVPNGFWSLKGRERPQRLRGVEEEREWDGGTRSGRDLRKID
jgi:hypothetical protein